MPNQTAADITVLCAFGFPEASLVFKRQTCVILCASSFWVAIFLHFFFLPPSSSKRCRSLDLQTTKTHLRSKSCTLLPAAGERERESCVNNRKLTSKMCHSNTRFYISRPLSPPRGAFHCIYEREEHFTSVALVLMEYYPSVESQSSVFLCRAFMFRVTQTHTPRSLAHTAARTHIQINII